MKADNDLTIQTLKKLSEEFVAERDWQQFHTPKNMSMDIAVEAAELMELFLWCESKDSLDCVEQNRQEIEDEVADVFNALLCFCNSANIDLTAAFLSKLEKVKKKYPVEKARGRAVKYTQLK